jgi:hypothetical protein
MLMLRLREEKKSVWPITGELNRMGIRTGRGSRWYASTVRLQLSAVRRPRGEAAAALVRCRRAALQGMVKVKGEVELSPCRLLSYARSSCQAPI